MPCRYDFQESLRGHLEKPATVVSVFDHVQMQGEHGAEATVDLPEGLFLCTLASLSSLLDVTEFCFLPPQS